MNVIKGNLLQQQSGHARKQHLALQKKLSNADNSGRFTGTDCRRQMHSQSARKALYRSRQQHSDGNTLLQETENAMKEENARSKKKLLEQQNALEEAQAAD